MGYDVSRREVLRALGAASAASVLPMNLLQDPKRMVRIEEVSPITFRLTVGPTVDGIPDQGFLVEGLRTHTLFEGTPPFPAKEVTAGTLQLRLEGNPLRVTIQGGAQELGFDAAGVSFKIGGPLLGLGEGGAQFDRRGSLDHMISGSGGYRLQSHGSRVPIPWLIGCKGWAIFFHQPRGRFDLTGAIGRFEPEAGSAAIDMFVVVDPEPTQILAEYARLTGHAELPPLWSLGYMQSHRTLGDRASVLAEAEKFREEKLPCDAMIYLGTGFCPNGWNVRNGSFEWNARVFPDPKEMISVLHKGEFKVVPHVVIEARHLRGSARDTFDPSKPNPEEAASYWDAHRPDFSMGLDGFWPDEGDWLDMPARLVRNRLYWEGPQIDRPNERPFALHRNGAPGMQRYASFLWSGDVYSRWETLRNQVPIGLNAGLSGIPYWGTDIGGFVPTPEFTAELYLRWFQFGAFCPLFRCHGRNWTLRLPWGWNTGDPGPQEVRDYQGAGLPDASQLHNAAVEPICRKYLELRYRLLPYLYSAVRETTKTGLPIMRPLWLHYPSDPAAVAHGDVYLWGRDILVAPVTERGATTRTLYLPAGHWYDFWTSEAIEGGREISRPVDLETIPLYIRAGAIIPMDPVRQYTGEATAGPTELHIYPGAEGALALYEDDGRSFDYRHGVWTGIEIEWSDQARALSLRLARGSKLRKSKVLHIRVGDRVHETTFSGRPIKLNL